MGLSWAVGSLAAAKLVLRRKGERGTKHHFFKHSIYLMHFRPLSLVRLPLLSRLPLPGTTFTFDTYYFMNLFF